MDNLSHLCRFCLKSGAINPLESVLHFIQHFSICFDVSREKNQYTVERNLRFMLRNLQIKYNVTEFFLQANLVENFS